MNPALHNLPLKPNVSSFILPMSSFLVLRAAVALMFFHVFPTFSTQLLRMFFRQQDELRRLKEELTTKDVRIRQLELELNNLKNVSPNNA